ncbi:MAG TPA: STAS domain-containing protein [Spirochaetota bacterium]|nr:STAS domain-containing protein [Spirochaetota bacterium]
MHLTLEKKGTLYIILLSGTGEYGDEIRLPDLIHKVLHENPTTIALSLAGMDTLNSAAMAAVLNALKVTDSTTIELLLYGANQNVSMLLEKVFLKEYVPILSEDEFNERYL